MVAARAVTEHTFHSCNCLATFATRLDSRTEWVTGNNPQKVGIGGLAIFARYELDPTEIICQGSGSIKKVRAYATY